MFKISGHDISRPQGTSFEPLDIVHVILNIINVVNENILAYYVHILQYYVSNIILKRIFSV